MTTSSQTRIDEVTKILAELKAEDAPVDDPRVRAAVAEFAQLLTAERLGRRVVSAMSLQERVLGR